MSARRVRIPTPDLLAAREGLWWGTWTACAVMVSDMSRLWVGAMLMCIACLWRGVRVQEELEARVRHGEEEE